MNDSSRRPRVAITGHRGASMRAPENTLASIERAIADGVDLVEIDAQLTADGQVVLFHDADLARVAGVDRRLADSNWADVASLDVGRWFAPEFAGETIPTLGAAIDLARGRAGLNVELKYWEPSPELAPRVVDVIRSANFEADCLVSSYDDEALQVVGRLAPDVRRGRVVRDPTLDAARFDVDFISLHAPLADRPRVESIRAAGKQVHVWTANQPEEALRLAALEVDAIMSDDPAMLVKVLRGG